MNKILHAGFLSLIFTLSFLSLGCSTAAKRSVPRDGAVRFAHGDPRVGTYLSSARGFETASYWIEGPTGLILVDTQFLTSATREAVEWAELATGKKVELAIVLHPNPDKFNGTAYLQSRGVRVVTSEQVLKEIPEVHKDRHHWFYERFKPDYPNDEPKPESFGATTRELSAGGVTVKAHVLPGPGCSAAHIAVEYDGHVFAGDLVSSLHHSWLEIGEVREWLKRIGELQALKPDYVHPGRGPEGGPELLERQKHYLENVVRLVRAEGARKHPSERAVARVQNRLLQLYPAYGNDQFLDIGLPAVFERLALDALAKHGP